VDVNQAITAEKETRRRPLPARPRGGPVCTAAAADGIGNSPAAAAAAATDAVNGLEIS